MEINVDLDAEENPAIGEDLKTPQGNNCSAEERNEIKVQAEIDEGTAKGIAFFH